MLPKARAALTAADEAAETARRAARGEQGVVRLAFNLTAGWEAVPTLLAGAWRDLPDVQVIASELWRGDAMAAQTAERFDVGIAPLADRSWPTELVFELLRDEPLMLAMGPSHRLAGNPPLPLGALAEQTFVTFGRAAPAYHETVLKLCRAAGFEPRLAEQALLPPAGWRSLADGRAVMLSRARPPRWPSRRA